MVFIIEYRDGNEIAVFFEGVTDVKVLFNNTMEELPIMGKRVTCFHQGRVALLEECIDVEVEMKYYSISTSKTVVMHSALYQDIYNEHCSNCIYLHRICTYSPINDNINECTNFIKSSFVRSLVRRLFGGGESTVRHYYYVSNPRNDLASILI